MKTGWTGGQYSAYRGLLALAMAIALVSRAVPFLFVPADASRLSGIAALILGLGLVACIALAVGFRDRIAAGFLLGVLIGVIALIDGAPLVMPGADVVLGVFLLALHLTIDAAPFGAWDARDRVDPAGDWQMPAWIPHLAWGALGMIHLVADLERIAGMNFRPSEASAGGLVIVGLCFDAVFVAATFRTRWRPAAWIALSLWKIAWMAAFGPAVAISNVWLLHLLAFDPIWLRGRSRFASSERTARLFYDGDCGFCHRTIRFVLAEDGNAPETLRMRFAPIASPAFTSLVEKTDNIPAGELPDSIVLEVDAGHVLIRSAAVLEIADRLGGYWRALGWVVGHVPVRLLDQAYDGFARVRKRIFAAPKASCPILPPALRARFDL